MHSRSFKNQKSLLATHVLSSALCVSFSLAVCASAFAQESKPKPASKPAQAPSKPVPAQQPSQSRPAAEQPAPAPQASGPRLIKSEMNAFEFWTVNCDHFENAPTRCVARLPVYRSADTKQVLLLMSVAPGADGQWQLVLNVPTGISITQGVQLRFGDKPTRTFPYQSCEPAFCTAAIPLDPSLRTDLAADNATVLWTSLTMGETRADFPIRGATQALSTLTK